MSDGGLKKFWFQNYIYSLINSKIPQSLPAGRQAHSAMHHVGCMAALNLTWFRAQSAFQTMVLT
jgi:hypothetical protein